MPSSIHTKDQTGLGGVAVGSTCNKSAEKEMENTNHVNLLMIWNTCLWFLPPADHLIHHHRFFVIYIIYGTTTSRTAAVHEEVVPRDGSFVRERPQQRRTDSSTVRENKDCGENHDHVRFIGAFDPIPKSCRVDDPNGTKSSLEGIWWRCNQRRSWRRDSRRGRPRETTEGGEVTDASQSGPIAQ